MVARRKLIDAFNHYLPCYANVAPDLGSQESPMLFVGKPIQASPPTLSSLWIEPCGFRKEVEGDLTAMREETT